MIASKYEYYDFISIMSYEELDKHHVLIIYNVISVPRILKLT